MANSRDQVRGLFSALQDLEDNFQQYALSPASLPDFSAYFLDPIDVDILKADFLKRMSENGTFSEALCLDAIYRFDSIKRDLGIRSKRRRDYYTDAPSEYEDEKLRLETSKINTLQYMLGNSEAQAGSS